MDQNIRGKVVVITGASSGIGEAVARHLAAKGASVALAARREDRIRQVVGEIERAQGRARGFTVDVTRKAEVDKLVSDAVNAFGRIDVMFNNAGLMALSPLDKLRVEEWDRMIDINIKGVLYGIAAALPVFEKLGSGHFINVSSIAGFKIFSPGGAVYSGTKFAVRAISEGLRVEAGKNIRSTVISPGAIETELKSGTSDQQSRQSVEAFYERNEIPADAVARAVAYAIEQPADVDINEIVIRPTAQEF